MKKLSGLLLASTLLLASYMANAAEYCFVLRNFTDAECAAHVGNTTNFNKCKARKKYAPPAAQPVWLLDTQVVGLNGAVQAEPPKLCYVKKPKKNKVMGYFKATQRHAFLTPGQAVITNPNIGTIDTGFVNPTPPPTVTPPTPPVIPPEPPTSTIVRNATEPPLSAKFLIWEGGSSTPPGPSKIWFGVGNLWVTKSYVSGSTNCNAALFDGFNPSPGVQKNCYYVLMSDLEQVLKPPAGVNYQPIVNTALTPPFNAGSSIAQIGPKPAPPSNAAPYAGAFRIGCAFSHMSNDDPIVFPGVPNATHHHTFFGNRAINAYTTPANIRLTGNSTCAGGILNRSGYWMPTLVRMSDKAPMAPSNVLVYYKAPDDFNGQYIKTFPAGLRMIAGNPKPLAIIDSFAKFQCHDRTQAFNPANWGILWDSRYIQACGGPNQYLRMIISFPQCWDGVNLDSPDHQSHMSYTCRDRNRCDIGEGQLGFRANSCPASHPIALPSIAINSDYDGNLSASETYRLSSDNYPLTYPGGYSLHADWMNGWDEGIIGRIVKNCLNERRDCGVANIGDGQTLTGFFVD